MEQDTIIAIVGIAFAIFSILIVCLYFWLSWSLLKDLEGMGEWLTGIDFDYELDPDEDFELSSLSGEEKERFRAQHLTGGSLPPITAPQKTEEERE